MSDQTGIQVYLKFEDEICQVGSVLDGQNLHDLITWKDSSPGHLVLNVIPRVGNDGL
jgi:ppGpp synthetase/RelA/SpoT-type nucleotidyltranferase